LRELEYFYAGFQHLVTGIGRSVRNGNPVAEEGRGLLLTRQHAINITTGDVACFCQCGGNLTNRLFFRPGLLADGCPERITGTYKSSPAELNRFS
jgi:hypothetical protein